MNQSLKHQFLLDPEITYLNHGSFGACPRPVLETQTRFREMLESRPIEFLGRNIAQHLAASRAALADLIHCAPENLVYFPNPTTAINMVVRSLKLEAGDEILTSDHEYGAMDRTWRFYAARRGWQYRNYPIPLPVSSHQEFIQAFWQGVSERTKVIFLSHITSQTALTFPVAEICQMARQARILTIIDGAHVPGQIPLNLAEIQPDIYTGACHKWLCAPKGAAFLYASPQTQTWLEPLVVSWGYQPEAPTASSFVDIHQWQGTDDPSAYLSVPAAIEFQRSHNWPQVRADCRKLAAETRQRINALTGLPPLCPDSPEWFTQLAAVRLPKVDTDILKKRLYDEFRIEIPVYRWQDIPILRISFQGYNTRKDTDRLLEALEILLPQKTLDEA